MQLNLQGKKALVTGGSKGIGLAIKQALEKEGVIVDSWSRSEGVDLNKDLWRKLPFDYDILINNAGGGGSMNQWDWDLIFPKNFNLMADLTNTFITQSKEWGRVITISSIYGKEKGHNASFTATKAAQIAFMKTLAGNHTGTTFNTICPGHIDVGKLFPDHPEIIGQPEDVASIVVFLCSDLAKHIDGACIVVDGGASHSF